MIFSIYNFELKIFPQNNKLVLCIFSLLQILSLICMLLTRVGNAHIGSDVDSNFLGGFIIYGFFFISIVQVICILYGEKSPVMVYIITYIFKNICSIYLLLKKAKTLNIFTIFRRYYLLYVDFAFTLDLELMVLQTSHIHLEMNKRLQQLYVSSHHFPFWQTLCLE